MIEWEQGNLLEFAQRLAEAGRAKIAEDRKRLQEILARKQAETSASIGSDSTKQPDPEA